MNLQIEAAARAYALKYGAIALPELVAWADNLIIDLSEPPTELFDLSLSKNFGTALSALNLIGVISNRTEIAKNIFGLFFAYLTLPNADYNRVSRGIYDMYFQELVPAEECTGEMLSYWDSLDLAEQGHYGNPEEVKDAMLRFLKKYKC
jgi:hypothetical protein